MTKTRMPILLCLSKNKNDKNDIHFVQPPSQRFIETAASTVCAAGNAAEIKRNKANQNFFLLMGLWMLLLMCPSNPAYAGVEIRITAANPSEISERTVEVKTYLPVGIAPGNVIDSGGLEIKYDENLRQYYVYKEVNLGPQESAAYNVQVDDIWLIDGEALSAFLEHAKDLRIRLKKSEYENLSSQLLKRIEKNSASILSKQDEFAVSKVSPLEHIGAYEINAKTLEIIKQDIGALENLVIVSGKDPGKIMGESSLAARAMDDLWSGENSRRSGTDLETVGAKSYTRSGKNISGSLEEEMKTIEVTIEVENPSAAESQTLPLVYYFPEEIEAHDVLDTGELTLRFDFRKKNYYVFKENVYLKPAEKKVFTVILRDKLSTHQAQASFLKAHVEKMTEALQDVKEFASTKVFGEQTVKKIDGLLALDKDQEFGQNYISRMRETRKKIEEIQKDIRRMEDVLLQAGVVPEITIVDEEMLQQEAETFGISRERLEQVRALKKKFQKSKMLPKGIKLLANTIFKGKAPTVETTWKIIFTIIGFLAVVSFIFFLVWAIQINKNKGNQIQKMESPDVTRQAPLKTKREQDRGDKKS